MTRRDGIIAAITAGVALMSGRANSDNSGLVTTKDALGNITNITMPKGALTFDLESFTQFTFTAGKDSVTLTPAEIMAALRQ